MCRQRSISFTVAASLSLAVHATAAVYFEPYPSQESAAPQSAPTLQLTLTAARPAPPQAVPETIPEPEPPPPPEVRPPPEPAPKPAPKPVAKPKPRPQPVPRKPPVTEVAETVKPVPEQVAVATRTETVAEKPLLTQVPRVSERENYLARLLAHIDSHKFYPRSARRRGINGEVKVSFYLLRDGTVRDLKITGGSKVLRKAARQAIYNAQSLPQPPETLGLQEPIRFGMVYRLEG